MAKTAFVTTPLRYPGGKSRALPQILPLIPADFAEFREPMVGGGSVFLRVKQLYPDRLYWINDVNYELYCFWKMAQTRNAELVRAVMRIREQATDGRELFYSLLEKYGTGDEFERAVRFFVLNRITFSGTVDSGGYSEGAFHDRFTISAIRNLARVALVLSDVRITCLDYAEVVTAPGERAFLFLDPPYYSVADSRLYGRRGELHLNFDHERFAQTMRRCPHRWLITYDDCPQVRELFKGAYMLEWTLQYGMNNYKQGRALPGKELFIANYDISRVAPRQLEMLLERGASYTTP
ncbi:MAG: methylase [Armatimonadota bacterium]|nr:MAG: methylase [Armatimonadota bacterium]